MDEIITENKKMKFPIAAIFLIIHALLNTITLFTNLFVYSRSYSWIYIFLTVFDIALIIALCTVLLRKMHNKVLFYITCLFVIQQTFYLIMYFSFFNLLNFLADLLIAFIVGANFLPPLSNFKSIAKKIYFIPSIVLLANALYIIRSDFLECIEELFEFGDIYIEGTVAIISSIISALPFIIGVFLFLNWCLDPYVKEKPTKENSNLDVNITENIDNSTNEAVLDYNESYCDLVKHILLSLFTFGIWMYIWIYKTTKALNKAPNSEKYDPTKKLLLCMFVPFYMIYWFYKHGEKIDKLNAVAGNKTDNTTMYLLLGIFIPVVACILMQDNINKLCTTEAYVAPTTNSEVFVSVPEKDEKNIAEALKEYKSLFDMGIITQEEFDQKKKQLLGL